jgi:hypothetical protein
MYHGGVTAGRMTRRETYPTAVRIATLANRNAD